MGWIWGHAHRRRPVLDLKLGLIVRETVERLKHHDLQHHHRIKGRPSALGASEAAKPVGRGRLSLAKKKRARFTSTRHAPSGRAGVIKCRQAAACRMPGRHALRCGFISSQDLTPVSPRGVPLCQPLAPEICLAVRRLRPHAATRHAAWRANFRGLDSTGDVLAEIRNMGSRRRGQQGLYRKRLDGQP